MGLYYFQLSGTCTCDDGYSGEDCSQSSLVTINKLIEGALVPASPPPRHGFTVVDCGPEGYVLFGGLSTISGLLNDLWRFEGQAWQQITPNCE